MFRLFRKFVSEDQQERQQLLPKNEIAEDDENGDEESGPHIYSDLGINSEPNSRVNTEINLEPANTPANSSPYPKLIQASSYTEVNSAPISQPEPKPIFRSGYILPHIYKSTNYGYRGMFGAAFIFSILIGALNVAGPYFIAKVIDRLQEEELEGENPDKWQSLKLWILLLLAGLSFVFSKAFNSVKDYLSDEMMSHVSNELTKKIVRNVNHDKYSEYQKIKPGELELIIPNMRTGVEKFFTNTFFLVPSVSELIFAATTLFIFLSNRLFGGIFVSSVFFSTVIGALRIKPSRWLPAIEDNKLFEGECVSQETNESLKNYLTQIIFDHNAARDNQLIKVLNRLKNVTHRFNISQNIITFLQVGIVVIANLLVLSIATALQENADEDDDKNHALRAEVADLVFMFSYIPGSLDNIAYLAHYFKEFWDGRKRISHSLKYLNPRDEEKPRELPISGESSENKTEQKKSEIDLGNKLIKRAIRGNISNVWIKFDSADTANEVELETWENLIFKRREGSVTALVGPSGCGKSTIINKFCQFSDENVGVQIRITTDTSENIDIQHVDNDSLWERVVLVPQEGQVYDGTLAQNLELAIPKINNKTVVPRENILSKIDEEAQKNIDKVYSKEVVKIKTAFMGILKSKYLNLVEPDCYTSNKKNPNNEPTLEEVEGKIYKEIYKIMYELITNKKINKDEDCSRGFMNGLSVDFNMYDCFNGFDKEFYLPLSNEGNEDEALIEFYSNSFNKDNLDKLLYVSCIQVGLLNKFLEEKLDRRVNSIFCQVASELLKEASLGKNIKKPLKEKIKELNEKSNHSVSALRFSGGEKQRIGIARAFLKYLAVRCVYPSRKFVFIFDESTSALDNEMEASIVKEIYRLRDQGNIIIMIAHRLPIILQADQILFLGRDNNKPKLLAQGSHYRLYDECERYRNFYDSGKHSVTIDEEINILKAQELVGEVLRKYIEEFQKRRPITSEGLKEEIEEETEFNELSEKDQQKLLQSAVRKRVRKGEVSKQDKELASTKKSFGESSSLFKAAAQDKKPTLFYLTEGDGDCFFHATWGVINDRGQYATQHAQAMRQDWHNFLNNFTSIEKMPKNLRDRMKGILSAFLERDDLIESFDENVILLRNNTVNNLNRNQSKTQLLLSCLITEISKHPEQSRAIILALLKNINKRDKQENNITNEIQNWYAENVKEDELPEELNKIQYLLIKDYKYLYNRLGDELKQYASLIDEQYFFSEYSISVENFDEEYDPDIITKQIISDEGFFENYKQLILSNNYYVLTEEAQLLVTLCNMEICCWHELPDKEVAPRKILPDTEVREEIQALMQREENPLKWNPRHLLSTISGRVAIYKSPNYDHYSRANEKELEKLWSEQQRMKEGQMPKLRTI